MRVMTKVQGGIAIDPRTNVYFNKDQVLEVGFKGLSKENLKRLVEIGFAVETTSKGNPKAEVLLEDDSFDEIVLKDDFSLDEAAVEEVDYKSFTKPSDLRKFAEEKYGIILNKKLGLADMVEQFENEINGDL